MWKAKIGFRFILIFCLFSAFLVSCKKDKDLKKEDIEETVEEEVNIMDFKKFTKTDQEMIQMAIDYASNNKIKKVYIPDGKYEVDATGTSASNRGIRLRSNLELRLSAQAVLKALPNDKPNYAVLTLFGVRNVKISGGKIKGERDEHYGEGGEWGMGIDIRESDEIEIKDIIIEDCWGDGIYIGGEGRNSKDISFTGITCYNNRRQGISAVNCDGLIIKKSIFSKTNGAAPQAGIDLEPNIGQSVKNVNIDDCQFNNNTGPGFFIYAGTGLVSDVTLSNCTFDKNSHAGINLNGGVPMVQDKNLNNVLLSNNVITNNQLVGLYINEANNIKVKNIDIKKSNKNAIRIVNGVDILIEDFMVEDFVEAGATILGSEGIELSTGTFFTEKQAAVGVKLESSKSVQLSSLEIKGGQLGVNSFKVIDLNASNIEFKKQNESAVYLNETDGAKFSNNRFEEVGKNTIKVLKSRNNKITDNTFIGNGISSDNVYSQIHFQGDSKENQFVGNTIQQGSHVNKPKYGVLLDVQTSLNKILNNTIASDSYRSMAIKDDGSNNETN